jgi:hypothetical protein
MQTRWPVVKCRWCDRVKRVWNGLLVCPRCDMRDGAKQKGAA